MPEPAAPASSDEEATGTADEGTETLSEVTARRVHIASQTSVLGKTSLGEQAAPGTGPGIADGEREHVGSLDRPPRPGSGVTGTETEGELVGELQVPPFVLLADRA